MSLKSSQNVNCKTAKLIFKENAEEQEFYWGERRGVEGEESEIRFSI